MELKRRGICTLLIGEIAALLVTVVLCVMSVVYPKDGSIHIVTGNQSAYYGEVNNNSNWNQKEGQLLTEKNLLEAEEVAEPVPEAIDEMADDGAVDEILSGEAFSEEAFAEEALQEELNQESTPEDPFSPLAYEKLATMTTEEKVAQLFIILPEALTGVNNQLTAGASTKNAYGKIPVGGFAFGSNNANGSENTKALLEGIEVIAYDRIGVNCFLLFREREGENRVAVAHTFDGQYLDSMIQKTTFGEVPEQAGVLNIYSGDASVSENAWMVTVSNQTNVELTGEEIPMCLSKVAYDRLRNENGYKGLLITESLSASEITGKYNSGEAAILAINAGADLLYRPDSFKLAYEEVLKAVSDGTISMERIDESVLRILTYKMSMDSYTEAPHRNVTSTSTRRTNNSQSKPQTTQQGQQQEVQQEQTAQQGQQQEQPAQGTQQGQQQQEQPAQGTQQGQPPQQP